MTEKPRVISINTIFYNEISGDVYLYDVIGRVIDKVQKTDTIEIWDNNRKIFYSPLKLVPNLKMVISENRYKSLLQDNRVTRNPTWWY